MELYWWLCLAKLNWLSEIFFGIIGVLVFIVVFGLFMQAGDPEEEVFESFSRWLNYLILLSFVVMLVFCFTPSYKDLALMYGWDVLHSQASVEVFESLKGYMEGR